MTTINVPVSLKWALWSAPLTLIFFIPSISDPFNLTKLLLLLLISTVTIILTLLDLRYGLAGNHRARENSKLIFLFGLFIFLVVLVGYVSTPNHVRFLWGAPGRANGVLYYFCVSVLSIVILVFMRLEYVAYIIRILKTGFLILIAYSLIQYLGVDPVAWVNPYNPIIGTLGNPNFSAAALATGAILFLTGIDVKGNKLKVNYRISDFSRISIGALSAFLAWKTNSFQGPVILITGLALIAYSKALSKLKSIAVQSILTGILLSLGLFALLSMAGVGPLGNLLQQYTLRLRGIYASIGVQAMLEKPVTGYGVDSYLIAFREFRTLDFVREFGTGTITNNAHSTPFQIGATFGVFVFAVYLLISLIIAKKAITSMMRNTGETHRDVEVISILWLLLFAQSLLSIEQLGLGTLTWLIGAILLGCKPEKETNLNQSKSKKSSRTSTVSGFTYSKEFGFVVFAFLTIPALSLARQDAAWKNLVGIEIKSVGDRAFVEEELSKLNTFILSEPEKLGQILPKLQDVGLGAEIKSLIDRSLKVNPSDSYAHELKSLWYRSNGENALEIEELKRITILDPFASSIWLRLGELYISDGDSIAAKQYLTRVIEIGGNPKNVELARKLINDLD